MIHGLIGVSRTQRTPLAPAVGVTAFIRCQALWLKVPVAAVVHGPVAPTVDVSTV